MERDERILETACTEARNAIIEAMSLILMAPSVPFRSWEDVTAEGQPYFVLNNALTKLEAVVGEGKQVTGCP